jgi:predicted nucleic-acid-binding Zn-ribbon protein
MKSVRPKCPKCHSVKFSLTNISLDGSGESVSVVYCSKCSVIISHSDKSLQTKPLPSKGGSVGFAPIEGV